MEKIAYANCKSAIRQEKAPALLNRYFNMQIQLKHPVVRM